MVIKRIRKSGAIHEKSREGVVNQVVQTRSCGVLAPCGKMFKIRAHSQNTCRSCLLQFAMKQPVSGPSTPDRARMQSNAEYLKKG